MLDILLINVIIKLIIFVECILIEDYYQKSKKKIVRGIVIFLIL